MRERKTKEVVEEENEVRVEEERNRSGVETHLKSLLTQFPP